MRVSTGSRLPVKPIQLLLVGVWVGIRSTCRGGVPGQLWKDHAHRLEELRDLRERVNKTVRVDQHAGGHGVMGFEGRSMMGLKSGSLIEFKGKVGQRYW